MLSKILDMSAGVDIRRKAIEQLDDAKMIAEEMGEKARPELNGACLLLGSLYLTLGQFERGIELLDSAGQLRRTGAS